MKNIFLKTAAILILMLLPIAQALAQTANGPERTYSNTELIEATAGFSSASWSPVAAKDLPNFGETVAVSPQNRGVLLYAEKQLALFNRANKRTHEKNENGKPISRIIPEAPICSITRFKRKWKPDGTRTNTSPVDLISMHVTAVLNQSPDFEISSSWIRDHVQSIVREKLADRFCGGNVATVKVEFWIAGVQHSNDGEIFSIAAYEYPEYRVGTSTRERSSFRVTSKNRSLWIRPFNAGFASASFHFWNKLSPGQRARLNDMGFLDPDGATTEVFGVSIAYGVSSYTPDGRLQDVN